MTPTHIGAAIRAARIERGLRQYDLARAAATHASILCHIERGRHEPHAGTLARIAAALGMSASALMARAEAGDVAAARRRVPASAAERARKRAQVLSANAARKLPPTCTVRLGRDHVDRATQCAHRRDASLRQWIESLIDRAEAHAT